MFQININSKSYQTTQNESKHVLKDFSMQIKSHEFITIVGPSGCGKTTLLRILAGFDTDFQGEILFSSVPNQNDNLNNFSKPQLLGNIGYVPQDTSLFPWLTVEENLRFGMKIKNIPPKEQILRSNQLLDLVNMKEYAKYYPKEISGGMKQKIAICRALAVNPTSNLILMDEPFSALDSQTRNTLQEDLLKIWESKNLTIVFVTHNIDEAVFLSTKVFVLSSTPSKIIHVENIGLSHPRERTSIEFNQIRKNLFQYFKKN
jgi:ABC-type nitrate/sulfonate/bicarbonate transport system ATPase subunit